MQLYYFLAVILSLCCGSLPESARSLPYAISFSAMLIGTWCCLCLMAARIIATAIERGEIPTELGCELFDRQSGYLRWLSLGLIVLCLGGFGLASNLGELSWVKSSLALQSVLLLTPALAVMIGLWAAEYAFDTRIGLREGGAWRFGRHLIAMFRGTVGWILAPLLALMILFDVASVIEVPGWIPGWIGWIAIAMVTLCCVPLLVRLMLTPQSIPDETHAWLRRLLVSAGEPKIGVMVWNTGGRAHNAMVAGFVGRFRTLVVSDRLLTDLTRQELAMVILHELAHVKRWHIPLRILSLVPAWVLGFTFERWASMQGDSSMIAGWGSWLGSALSIGLTIVMMRLVSHRIEHDADQYATKLAIKLAPQCQDVPSTEEEAAKALASALLCVTRDSDAARRSTWLHPGIRERLDELGVVSFAS
ncbi:MAG: M48 family metalloprotease [Planctomycetota bacterium]